MLFSSLYNEHFTCKNAFVHNDQDTALKSVTLCLSLSLCLCLSLSLSLSLFRVFAGEEE